MVSLHDDSKNNFMRRSVFLMGLKIALLKLFIADFKFYAIQIRLHVLTGRKTATFESQIAIPCDEVDSSK